MVSIFRLSRPGQPNLGPGVTDPRLFKPKPFGRGEGGGGPVHYSGRHLSRQNAGFNPNPFSDLNPFAMPWASLALNQEAAPKEAGSPAIAAAHSSKSHKPENLGSAAWKGDNSKKTTLKKQHEHLTMHIPTCMDAFMHIHRCIPCQTIPSHAMPLHYTAQHYAARQHKTLHDTTAHCTKLLIYNYAMYATLHYVTWLRLHRLHPATHVFSGTILHKAYNIYIYIYIC